MATVAFDTLKLARRLEAAGFAREQAVGAAEAIADVVGEAVVTRDYFDHRLGAMESRFDRRIGDLDVKLDHLDAKFDHRSEMTDAKFDRRFGETDAKTAAIEANLRIHISDTRTELLKWVIGLMLGQTAIVAALVKLL